MNIVLDTNCLLIAISDRSRFHRVWQAFTHGDYTLCVTNEIIEEYAEVISRNINERVAQTVIYLIMTLSNVNTSTPISVFILLPPTLTTTNSSTVQLLPTQNSSFQKTIISMY
jgi:predicted nucleic acid-binding protein